MNAETIVYNAYSHNFLPCAKQRYHFVKSWKNFRATTDRTLAEQFNGQQERQ
jgi:hypothetical protein